MTETVERIVLASRPVGEPTLDSFRLEEFPIPQPGPDRYCCARCGFRSTPTCAVG
jgi:NADPH-dependent curcumin reductase CurA